MRSASARIAGRTGRRRFCPSRPPWDVAGNGGRVAWVLRQSQPWHGRVHRLDHRSGPARMNALPRRRFYLAKRSKPVAAGTAPVTGNDCRDGDEQAMTTPDATGPAVFDPAGLDPAQRDGRACVACHKAWPCPEVKVGRLPDDREVYACDDCAVMLPGGAGTQPGPVQVLHPARRRVPVAVAAGEIRRALEWIHLPHTSR